MNELGKTLTDVFAAKYVIPLYQRNFAWRVDEVQQLLQDVYDAFRANPNGNYYIGSLVVLKRHNGDLEVIDGQQRLTVISMIAVLLKKLSRSVLSYDSRPDVQTFLDAICCNPESASRIRQASLYHLKEAYDHISKAKVILPNQTEGERFLKIGGIADFFMNHVVLVVNEIPEDTDVAAYFEIMNNRGEQLQKHELVKAEMLNRIRTSDNSTYDMNKQCQFASIWDACSQMEVPIQRLFSTQERIVYFGEQYDGFSFAAKEGGVARDNNSYSILEVLNGDLSAVDSNVKHDEEGLPETDVYKYGSIMDFSNFLMHVLRLYLDVHADLLTADAEIPLHEKELLPSYRKYKDKIDSMKFIKLLLFCRIVFDRFVIKTSDDARDQDDGQKWELIKPKRYDKGWKFVPAFGGNSVVKALSMLQVTFRAKVYKQWLFSVLKWLYDESYENGDLSSITEERYLGFLHGYMLKYYQDQDFNVQKVGDDEHVTPDNSYSKGTDTPHFLLNFIDYLYWCKSVREGSSQVRDFDFKYWNSVEHHLAQNKVEDGCPYIDNLGNLCLVSKSSNSRLSDRDVKEKVEAYGHGNLGPNRQVIYAMTMSDRGKEKWSWGEKEIREHYNEIAELLEQRETVLGT